MNIFERPAHEPHRALSKRSEGIDNSAGVIGFDGVRAQMLDVWSYKNSPPPPWLANDVSLYDHLRGIVGEMFPVEAKSGAGALEVAPTTFAEVDLSVFDPGISGALIDWSPSPPVEPINWAVPFTLG